MRDISSTTTTYRKGIQEWKEAGKGIGKEWEDKEGDRHFIVIPRTEEL